MGRPGFGLLGFVADQGCCGPLVLLKALLILVEMRIFIFSIHVPIQLGPWALICPSLFLYF